jgi:hypothetical protein
MQEPPHGEAVLGSCTDFLSYYACRHPMKPYALLCLPQRRWTGASLHHGPDLLACPSHPRTDPTFTREPSGETFAPCLPLQKGQTFHERPPSSATPHILLHECITAQASPRIQSTRASHDHPEAAIQAVACLPCRRTHRARWHALWPGRLSGHRALPSCWSPCLRLLSGLRLKRSRHRKRS